MAQRAVQINSVYGTGSTGRIVQGLKTALERSGWDSWAAFGRSGVCVDPHVIRIGRRADVYGHVALTRLFDLHGRGSSAATRAFITELDRLHPDVVHLHNIHGYYLNVELLFDYLRRSDIRTIWTLHDCWAFTGHCAYFDLASCDRWATHCRECPQRGEYPSSWFVDRSSEAFDWKRDAFSDLRRLTIVTPSEWLARNVRQSFLGQYPVRVVRNGIDLDTFRPTPSAEIRARLGISPERSVVLCVAANFESRSKGFACALELANRLHRSIAVVLVGVSETQRRHLPSNVIGLVRTESIQDLAALYSMANAFVNPTLEDNFPTVALEALACETPIVTFDTGGCPEQVNEHTGVVVRRGDVDALARATTDVIAKGKHYYASACRLRSSEYSTERMIREYLDLYRAVS